MCPNCGNVFQVLASLKRHVKYSCRRTRPKTTDYSVSPAGYVCQACKRIYKSIGTLKRHLKYECGKSPTIQCPVTNCYYKAKLNFRMQQHVWMVHNLIPENKDGKK